MAQTVKSGTKNPASSGLVPTPPTCFRNAPRTIDHEPRPSVRYGGGVTAPGSYRAEFRDLFEVHFSRFETKLEQRAGELRAEMGAMQTRLDARLDQRTAELDARWEKRFAELDAKWEKRSAELGAKWEHRIGELKNSLILWMFGFWMATTFIMLGTTIAILKL